MTDFQSYESQHTEPQTLSDNEGQRTVGYYLKIANEGAHEKLNLQISCKNKHI